MSAGFTNVTSITTCTRKFIHDARTERLRERIFPVEQVLKFERRKNKVDINRFTESTDEFTHSILCDNGQCRGSCLPLLLLWICNDGLTYLRHVHDIDSYERFQLISEYHCENPTRCY